MNPPPVWTLEQLERHRDLAIEVFCEERLTESLEGYGELFETFQGHLENLLEATDDLRDLKASAVDLLTEAESLLTLRYIAGPPISEDDLKILARTNSLTRSRLEEDDALVERLIQIMLDTHDRRRFPWLSDRRDPTDEERRAGILASAAMIAMRRQETLRRGDARLLQEQAVADALKENAGFQQVATRTIALASDAPRPGTFCRESLFGDRKADFVVGLLDGRILAIECKVSNSGTNSIKRLNNDAAVKANQWIGRFGTAGVVPAAMLGGVYKVKNLADAQSVGLTLFWAHDLRQFTDWVLAGRK